MVSQGATSTPDRARSEEGPQSCDDGQGRKATKKQGTRRNDAPCPRKSTKPPSLATTQQLTMTREQPPTCQHQHNFTRRRGGSRWSSSARDDPQTKRSAARLATGLETTRCTPWRAAIRPLLARARPVSQKQVTPRPRASQNLPVTQS